MSSSKYCIYLYLFRWTKLKLKEQEENLAGFKPKSDAFVWRSAEPSKQFGTRGDNETDGPLSSRRTTAFNAMV